jgi:hypothetical protein
MVDGCGCTLERSEHWHVQAGLPSAAGSRVSNDNLHMRWVACFIVQPLLQAAGRDGLRELLTDSEAGYGQSTIRVNSNDNCVSMSSMLGLSKLGCLRYSQIIVVASI